MCLGFLGTILIVLQTTDSKRSRLFLMANSTSMFPQRNSADMKLLDVVDGADRKLTFFSNRKAVEMIKMFNEQDSQ